MKTFLLSLILMVTIGSAAFTQESPEAAQRQATDAIQYLMDQIGRIAELQASLTTMQATVNAMTAEVATLQASNAAQIAEITELQAIAQENTGLKTLLRDIMKYLEMPAMLLRRLLDYGITTEPEPEAAGSD